MRAERPLSSFFPMRPGAALPIAKPGRSTCSKKPLRTAGMSPSQSGNTMTRCSAQAMVRWACAIGSGRRLPFPFLRVAQQRQLEPRDVDDA